MIFTFEALQADHGDALLLHYGDGGSIQTMVIDSGPGSVYWNYVRKRLLEVKDEFSPGSPLELPLVMVSHMDDDHVNGILDLTRELRDAKEDQEEAPFRIKNLWFNSFDDIIGNIEIPTLSGLGASASVADLTNAIPELAGVDEHVGAVLASTGQGRRLRNDAEFLVIPVNEPFSEMNGSNLVRGDSDDSVVDRGDWPKITVINPNEERLKDMQEKWDRDLRRAEQNGDNSIIYAALASMDTSPFNLASIVCVVEAGGKTILLTGDARSDDILAGLDKAGMLDAHGKAHFDILKIPHHGSDRNVSTSFFEKVSADHYVISGNGKHHNPDRATLVMLSIGTRGRDDFTIHLTNEDGQHHLREVLERFISEDRDRGRTYGFEYRHEDALSLKIDLGDPMQF